MCGSDFFLKKKVWVIDPEPFEHLEMILKKKVWVIDPEPFEHLEMILKKKGMGHRPRAF